MSTDQKITKEPVGLLKLAEMLGSVSQACKVMGYFVIHIAFVFPVQFFVSDRV